MTAPLQPLRPVPAGSAVPPHGHDVRALLAPMLATADPDTVRVIALVLVDFVDLSDGLVADIEHADRQHRAALHEVAALLDQHQTKAAAHAVATLIAAPARPLLRPGATLVARVRAAFPSRSPEIGHA